MHVVMSILLFSIQRYSSIDEEEIEETVLSKDIDIDMFNAIFNYINLLFNKCMPKNKNESNILFEEELDSLEEDWDFAHMEYMWYSILKRSDDFFKVTPKTFFEQMDIYKRINNIENEEVDYI